MRLNAEERFNLLALTMLSDGWANVFRVENNELVDQFIGTADI